MKVRSVVVILLLVASLPLLGQNAADEEVDALLDAALRASEEGEWEQAFALLDQAEAVDPDDPRVADYRRSISELQAVDESQESWVDGVPMEVAAGGAAAAGEEGDDGEPKFTIDRGEVEGQATPESGRDNFNATLGFSFLAVDGTDPVSTSPMANADEFLASGIKVDLRYWFPFFGRRLGLGVRYDGFAWPPGDASVYYYTVDFTARIRGFLIEAPNSRLEIGLNLGVSLLSTRTPTTGESNFQTPFILGLYLSDPLFFHLFSVDALEPLVFEGELLLYTFLDTLTLDLVSYRVDAYWRFPAWRIGLRFDLDDFIRSDIRRTVWSLGFFGGVHF